MSRAVLNRANRAVLILALLLTIVALAYTLKLEFGTWREHALQVDELHFSACAARSLIEDVQPSRACHDNKGPGIYALYELILAISGGYEPWVIKLFAYITIGGLLGLTAWLGNRLGGTAAALLSPTLLLQALLTNSSFQALKTETAAMLLVLFAAVALLMKHSSAPRAPQLLLAGLLLGLATLVKQTYALLFPMVSLWLLLVGGGANCLARLKVAAIALLWCGGVGLLLFCLTWAWFFAQGAADEFLAAFFLYPAVYAKGPPSTVHEIVYRLSSALDYVAAPPALLFAGVAFALPTLWHKLRQASTGQIADADTAPLTLLALFALPIAFSLVAAPTLFPYHAVPLWIALAPIAAYGLSALLRSMPSSMPSLSTATSLLVIASALSTLNHVWRTNAGRGPTEKLTAAATIEGAAGRFGYVIGHPDPHFYTDNKLIPASAVIYPWALPGIPDFWAYTVPKNGSVLADKIRHQQERNQARLLDDFRRTPPSYIAIRPEPGWALPKGRLTPVPDINDYLQIHCRFHSTFSEPSHPGRVIEVLKCN